MAKSAKPRAKKSPKAAAAPALDPDLIAEALDYRTQGYSIPDIATQMKRGVLEVETLIAAGLEEGYQEPPHFAIQMELRRLNMAQQQIVSSVVAGDKDAIRLMFDIEQKIARVKLSMAPSLSELFGNSALLRRANMDNPNEKKNGRPPYKWNHTHAMQVQALAQINTPLRVICKILGVGHENLLRHYSDIIETARHALVGLASGVVTQALEKGDTQVALKVLERTGPPEWKPPVVPTSQTTGGADKSRVDPAAADVKHTVEIVGGLPKGSTPENPGGTDHSDIPPEESHG